MFKWKDRGYYSMMGKAIIGIVGGVILLLLSLVKMCNNQGLNNAQNKWAINRIETIRNSDNDSISLFFSAKISNDSIKKIISKIKENRHINWRNCAIKYHNEFEKQGDIREVFTFIQNDDKKDSCIVYLEELSLIIGLDISSVR